MFILRARTARSMGALCVSMLIILAGCKQRSSESPAIRISMIPTTDPGKLLRASAPVKQYWQNALHRDVDLTVPTNYAAVVEALVHGQVDIAYLGGFTYLQASSRASVVPLVQRDVDQKFHSVFITRPDSGIHSLQDLKGHTFAFGDINSTSGHLMPSYFMSKGAVDPSVIEKAIYSGGHDATALSVENGKVDAGAMDELVYKKMIDTAKLSPAKVVVFYRTPEFFDYVWVCRKDLDPAVAAAFAQAMLDLDTAKDAEALKVLNAGHYVKAADASYEPLREAAKADGLLH